MEVKNSPDCGSPLGAPAGIIYEPIFYFVFYSMKHLPAPAALQNHFPHHCPCSAECTALKWETQVTLVSPTKGLGMLLPLFQAPASKRSQQESGWSPSSPHCEHSQGGWLANSCLSKTKLQWNITVTPKKQRLQEYHLYLNRCSNAVRAKPRNNCKADPKCILIITKWMNLPKLCVAKRPLCFVISSSSEWFLHLNPHVLSAFSQFADDLWRTFSACLFYLQ